jgi:CubicO group peptidase (beta-lactamase class C family)
LQSDIKIIELETLNSVTFPTPMRQVLLIALCLLSLNTIRTDAMTRLHTPPPPPGLETYLHSEMKQRQIPGMQVAVIQHGKIVLLEGFGLANIEHGIPVTNDTVFQINSVTKAFTGVAIMQLVESGKLDLSAPVSRYLGGLPTAWQPITVKQLATHESGLPNIMNNATARLIVDGDPAAAWSKVQTLPLAFSPGERFSYNQTNYLVLGKIIDKLSGQRFAQFIKDRLLDVVRMPHTIYGDDRDIILGSATTYTFMRVCTAEPVLASELCKPHVEFPEFLRTAGGLNSTAQDIARWVIALQQGDLLKEKASVTTLWAPGQLNDGTPGPWAIGWPVVQRAKHPVYMPTGGGKVALGLYPDDDLAVIVLTNLSWEEPRQLVDGVAAYYIPDLTTAAPAN